MKNYINLRLDIDEANSLTDSLIETINSTKISVKKEEKKPAPNTQLTLDLHRKIVLLEIVCSRLKNKLVK